MKKASILFALIIILPLSLYAQKRQNEFQFLKKEQLLDFARTREQTYLSLHKQAVELAELYGIPVVQYVGVNGLSVLQYFHNKRPIYYSTNNIIAAASVSADLLWPEISPEFGLTGDNVEVGLWDGGYVFQQHQELLNDNGLIWQRDNPKLTLNHSTHVAGTIKAKGIDINSKGLASEAYLLAYDFSNDEAEMAVAASEMLLLSNHSYGKVCGWSYNTSNENWFWHGDLTLNEVEDKDFGHYDSICWNIDYITNNAPYYLMVKSAGNDRNEGPSVQPIDHYDWNEGWYSNNDIHDLDGGEDGYKSLCSVAVAKNNLVVGAVNDLPEGYQSEEFVLLEKYSACGPTNDGRLKPDVVANGSEVYSCISEDDGYASYNGTSMAAANASGAISLLLQLQQEIQPGVYLWSSTVKGLVIHTADECGPSPGPDYRYGYGLLNAYKAASLLKRNVNSGGELIIQDSIREAETKQYEIRVDEGTEQLKFTLCWTDPPGPVNDLTNAEVNKALVNDLNLIVKRKADNELFYPWVMDPLQPELPASTGENHVDNVEQLVINQPQSGAYFIEVSGLGLETNQLFSLIAEGGIVSDHIFPPKNLFYRIDDSAIKLFWDPPKYQPSIYHVYKNGSYLQSSSDTSCIIGNLINGDKNSYYVTAQYSVDGEKESLPSNTVIAASIAQVEVPYLTSFEDGTECWSIMQDCAGWKWGNKDSLTSYYLNFEANDSKFLWIDSGIVSGSTHVSDVACSSPVNLAGKDNIRVSFSYVFMSGIYDVIDELHVVCRQVGDSEWTKIGEVIPSAKWKYASFEVPDYFAKSNVQIGFYYDDFYRWGMGAAIDDVMVDADFATHIDRSLVDKFEIKVYNNIVEISNDELDNQDFQWRIYDLLGRIICSGNDELINGRASFFIENTHLRFAILNIGFANKEDNFKIVLEE